MSTAPSTAPSGAPSTAPSAPRAAWLARALLLGLAVLAVVGAFVLSRPTPGAAYACPMHPEVRAPAPGVCPLCGMALGQAPGATPAASAAAPAAFTLPGGELFLVRPRTFSRDVTAPARVEADGAVVALLAADELEGARTEEGGAFVPSDASAPPAPIASEGAPPVTADATTSWVRFRFPSGGPAFPAGAVGWATWPARPRTKLVVPDTAIVRGAEGAYVLVAAGGAPLGVERRDVRVGKVFLGLGVVVAGLAPGDRVVGDGAFSWDAERRLRVAAEPAP